MISPSWDSFASPKKRLPEEEEKVIEFESGKISDEMEPQPQKPEWGDFQSPNTYQGEIDQESEEDWFDYIKRNSLSLASRAAEQFLGAAGNVEKFAKDILVNAPSHAGSLGEAFHDLLGKDRWEQMVRGRPSSRQTFPTSQTLKEVSEEISEGYTKPRTKGEKAVHEYVEDVAALATPSPVGKVKGAINLLAIPAAANLMKQTVDWLGFGEDKAQMAKMAIWLPLMMANNVNGQKYASNLMNEGRNGIPSTVKANVPRLDDKLTQVQNSMLKVDPRTQFAISAINDIKKDLSFGNDNVKSLMTMYDAVNAIKRNKGLFELGKSDRGFALANIDKVKNTIRDEILNASQAYPEAIKSWQNGLSAWATIHKSKALTNEVGRILKGPYGKAAVGASLPAFGIGGIGAYSHPLISGGTTATAAGAYKTGQILYRIWNDKNLAKYYFSALNNAAQQNAPAFIKDVVKLNKELGLEGLSVKKSNENKSKNSAKE